jgi:hypothetical protein
MGNCCGGEEDNKNLTVTHKTGNAAKVSSKVGNAFNPESI